MNLRRIEECALNAWPALQTYLYDGWLLRFANGYSKRANSVTPLYAGELDIDEKIAHCETIFAEKRQSPIFRLPNFLDIGSLNRQLAKRGYRQIDTTSVQTVDLETPWYFQSERAYIMPYRHHWLSSFHALENKRKDVDTHDQIIGNIASPHCLMVLMDEGQVVACGYAVCESGYLGLFDIVTDPDQRRKGYGRELLTSLLAWGQEIHDAHTAYLQVMVNNTPALNLYAQFGFEEQYQYSYCIG